MFILAGTLIGRRRMSDPAPDSAPDRTVIRGFQSSTKEAISTSIYTQICILQFILYSVQYKLYSVHYTAINCTVYNIGTALHLYTIQHTAIQLYTVHCTVYSYTDIHCTVYSYTLYSIQLYTVHYTIYSYSLYSIQLYTVHYTVYSIQYTAIQAIHCM